MFNLYKENDIKLTDSDSSIFSWIDVDGKKERNPDFPNNYIEHIKKKVEEGYTVLTSTHKSVIDSMIENDIDFVIVMPDKKLKADYIKRYENRGSDKKFIDLMETSWDTFIKDLSDCNAARIVLHSSDQYLSDVVNI